MTAQQQYGSGSPLITVFASFFPLGCFEDAIDYSAGFAAEVTYGPLLALTLLHFLIPSVCSEREH